MNDISDLSRKGLPTTQSLLKATAVALGVALVALTLFILPAEYGVDPTGVGTRLGLTAMSSGSDQADQAEEVPLTPATAAQPISVLDAVWKSETPFRNDELSLTLGPNEGAEIKARMQVGDRFMFSWTAEGPVSFDMHGEETGAKNDEFTSYWKGRGEQTGNGAFQAPFAGTHGWYWRNRGSTPVTVHVRTSGYYEKLFRP